MSPRPRRHRRRRSGQRVTKFAAGAIGIVLVVLLSYGCYTKFANPFANPFTIHATFQDANGLNIGSPVRIAGVNVGKVTGVSSSHGPGLADQGADVTMTIDSAGLPVHRNATFWIRPRIFLEGNFFVDLYPGTPEAPTVGSGHTFPLAAGREPVQLDQVLDTLQSSTRTSLQELIQQYGEAIDESGAAYNASIKYWLPAYKYTGEVTHDFLGTRPGDLTTAIDQGATVSESFDHDPPALKALITNFDTTAGEFADERTALAQAVNELPTTLSTATPAFDALNSSLPALDRLSAALLPGVRSTGGAIDRTLPFVTQLRALVAPDQLRALASDLKSTIPSLAHLTEATIPLMKNEVRPLSSCVANVVYPWSQLTIDDGVLSGTAGFPLRKVFQEAVDYLPGLGGESASFDANGPYIRTLLSGGSLTYSLSAGMFGQSLEPIEAVQPQLPAGGTEPPLEPTVPCETQTPYTQSTIQAAPSAPIQSVSSNTDAPGASLRWKDAVEAAIGEMGRTAGQQGQDVTVSSALAHDLGWTSQTLSALKLSNAVKVKLP